MIRQMRFGFFLVSCTVSSPREKCGTAGWHARRRGVTTAPVRLLGAKIKIERNKKKHSQSIW
jgi:hypothetical protein